VTPLGEGWYSVRPRGPQGEYRVSLFAHGGGGDMVADVWWVTPSDRPLPEPSARLSLIANHDGRPDSYGLELSVTNLPASPTQYAATITVTASGVSGTVVATVSAAICHPIVNEVQSGDSDSAANEWVELYNPCGNSITFSGKLVYRSDTNNTSTDTSTLATITSASIPAGGYFLIANSGYTGTANISPFDSTSVGMADGGGGVGLRDSGGTLLTSMGWGTANNTFQQGSAAPTEATGKSIARTPNGADTHHDNVDFKSATPTPKAAN
jgi:hypothetical protein